MRISSLSVLMCQLDMTLDCNSTDEYLVETESFKKQIYNVFEIMQNNQPDITMFPEMAYMPEFDETYKQFSEQGKIVIAGSHYKEGINYTVVFQDEKKYEIQKGYASGAEPMARKISYVEPEEFIIKELEEHKFQVKGKNIYIFNCMEYYHVAYYVARNAKCNENLFGIFTICSNSNTHVFEEETVAIHNHNESIYTFMLNCVSTYKGESYGDGQSYIYGPVSIHEKEWLGKEKVTTKKNPMHILSLSKNKAQYVFGEFIFSENLSRFGRSDRYTNNPRNIFLQEV